MTTPDRIQTWLLLELRRIRKRPGMYLYNDRLISLACYIRGVIYGLELAGVKGTDEAGFLASFGEWIGQRLGLEHGDCWFYLMSCHPQRTGHIEDFYRELDIYLKERGFENGLEDERIDVKAWRIP